MSDNSDHKAIKDIQQALDRNGISLSQEARAEKLAQLFHETYERLAPAFGYETRKASAKPWADVPEQNKKLMIAVCEHILTVV